MSIDMQTPGWLSQTIPVSSMFTMWTTQLLWYYLFIHLWYFGLINLSPEITVFCLQFLFWFWKFVRIVLKINLQSENKRWSADIAPEILLYIADAWRIDNMYIFSHFHLILNFVVLQGDKRFFLYPFYLMGEKYYSVSKVIIPEAPLKDHVATETA